MPRVLTERRLRQVAERLKALRADLAVTDEQLIQLADEAEDSRIRAMVSETPLAGSDHRDAHRHYEAMLRHRHDVVAEIERLEARQDELLDQLTGG